MDVVHGTVRDVSGLHSKLDRKASVETRNMMTSTRFQKVRTCTTQGVGIKQSMVHMYMYGMLYEVGPTCKTYPGSKQNRSGIAVIQGVKLQIVPSFRCK